MSVLLRVIGVLGFVFVCGLGADATAQVKTKPPIDFDESQVEELLEKKAKSMEEWAEKHSADWEEWAEVFEAKMEAWGKKQEVIWEEWAETYSANWEQWGEELETGELKEADMKKLLSRNLEMLSDMPIGELVDGLLKDGLQELKNAPWGSLDELQALVGVSIEKSLNTIEKESTGEHANEVHEALHKLRHLLDAKSKKLGVHSKRIEKETLEKLKALRELGSDGKAAEMEAKILAALQKGDWTAASGWRQQTSCQEKGGLSESSESCHEGKERRQTAETEEAGKAESQRGVRQESSRNARQLG